MLENDRTVEETRHCLAREDLFHIKQLQNVYWVCSREPEESLLNDCKNASVDCVADRHGTAVLHLTGKSMCKEDAGHGLFGTSNPNQGE